MAEAKPAVDKKVLHKALNKRGKTKKDKYGVMSYAIWIGAVIALIVGGVVILIINPEKKPHQMAVNDDLLIAQINSVSTLFKAGASAFFENWSIGDVKKRAGIGLTNRVNPHQCNVNTKMKMPAEFDAREKWPACFKHPVYDAGNCTSTWAIMGASTVSNRFCIQDPNTYSALRLSPQTSLSCDTLNRGCDGGDLDTMWFHYEKEGLVTEKCFPYTADPDVGCEEKCNDEQPLKIVAHCLVHSEDGIKREVLQNGPVVAPVTLNDDLLVYKQGIYKPLATAKRLVTDRRYPVIHAVKIIGWGEKNRQPYWLVENAWGEDWGEGGYAKIAIERDTKDKDDHTKSVVLSYCFAPTPSNKVMEEQSTAGRGGDEAKYEADLDLAADDLLAEDEEEEDEEEADEGAEGDDDEEHAEEDVALDE